MKALLRPAFVLGLSIAIAVTSLVGSSSVASAATPPLVTTWWLDLPVYEGADVFLNGTFTGGVGHGPYTVDVDWLGDGTGTFETYTFDSVDPTAYPQIRVQKAQPYPNEQAAPITVAVYLSDPQKTNRTNLPAFTISNVPPSFESFSLSATDLETGGAVTATGTFKDGGANDTHTLRLDWGDGSPVMTMNLDRGARDFTTEAHTYSANGDYTVSAIVTDDAGAWTPATATFSVHAANQTPSVVSFDVTAGSEGGDSTLALTFADVDAPDTHTVSVAWGDGATTNSGTLASTVTTFDATHVYADTGPYALVLTLRDSANHTVTAGRSVSPTNVGPVLGALTLSPSSVVDHQELTLTGSFTDPGATDTFTLTVDWGDGKSSEQPLDADGLFSATHSYDAARSLTITVTVKDRDGAESSSSVPLVVLARNHAPTGLAFNATVTGSSVVVNGTFSDSDPADMDTVVVIWGDGASERQTLAAEATSFTASHVYLSSKIYTVTATVNDPAGASTSPLSKQVVVTVPSDSAADVLDEMAWLVRSLDLDRNTERWLLKKLDDLKSSLQYGNGQVCASNGAFNHFLAFAQRTLTQEQYAELSALAMRVGDAAGCTTNGNQLPKVQKAATVTKTTVTPALTKTPALPQTPAQEQKKDKATKDATKTAKAESKPTAGRNSN
jgi:PKD domain-containing protein